MVQNSKSGRASAVGHAREIDPRWLNEGSINLSGSFFRSVAFKQTPKLVNGSLMAGMGQRGRWKRILRAAVKNDALWPIFPESWDLAIDG
jgi:hypothetical protein